MPLSMPKARRLLHTRTIDLRGYYRDDGLWDIEARFADVKTYSYESRWRGTVPAGHPVHDMALRLTLDRDRVVVDIEAIMDVQPYTLCSDITPNFKRLIGVKVGPGWNRKVREAVGGVEGCTHLAELLGPLATVTFQTLSGDYAKELMGVATGERGKIVGDAAGDTPFMLNGCYTWASDSPVVQQDYPLYYKPRAPRADIIGTDGIGTVGIETGGGE